MGCLCLRDVTKADVTNNIAQADVCCKCDD